MHVNWNFTYKCIFNCEHCYSRTRTDVTEISLEDKLKVAQNLVRNKVFNVNLGGGEPLLSQDCLPVIRYLSSNGIRVNLSTNGWKATNDMAKELKSAGLGGVAISIDHIDSNSHDMNRNMPGSLCEAYKAVEIYSNAGIDVYFSTTITSNNFDCIESIIQKGVSLGIKGIDLKRLKTMGNAHRRSDLELTPSQVNVLYQNVAKWKQDYPLSINLVYGTKRIPNIDSGCPCGKTSLAIMSNGDISPCVYNVRVIGNAVTDDIHDVWCTSPQLKYLRENFSCLGLE